MVATNLENSGNLKKIIKISGKTQDNLIFTEKPERKHREIENIVIMTNENVFEQIFLS